MNVLWVEATWAGTTSVFKADLLFTTETQYKEALQHHVSELLISKLLCVLLTSCSAAQTAVKLSFRTISTKTRTINSQLSEEPSRRIPIRQVHLNELHINADKRTLVDCAVGTCPAGYLPCWSGPRAGCWVLGLRRPRSDTRQVESVRGEPAEKRCGAWCCCLTTQTAHKTLCLPEFTAESRVTRVSPLPAPSVGAVSWIHSLQNQ